MARPKEFERDAVLARAIPVFADHGFEGTSTETVLAAMGISRQSMYDTFGDKWRLYLAALQSYVADSVTDQLHALNAPASPLAGIKGMIEFAVAQAISDASPKCLGVGAVCEFGRSNVEVATITDISGRLLLSALERRLVEAKAAGEIAADLDIGDTGHFLRAALTGIKVLARGGATPEILRGVGRTTLRSLR